MANRSALNGSSLNGSSLVAIAAAAVLVASGSVSADGVLVFPGATLAASSCVVSASLEQFHQAESAQTAVGGMLPQPVRQTPIAADVSASATFVGTVAPAGGNAAMSSGAVLDAQPVVVKYVACSAQSSWSCSATTYAQFLPVISVTSGAEFHADPGGTYGGITSFNATGRMGVETGINFTVEAIRVVVTNASFGSTSSAFAVAGTYSHLSTTASPNAIATISASARHTHQIGASLAASGHAQAATSYYAKATASPATNAVLDSSVLMRLAASSTCAVSADIAAEMNTIRFGGYQSMVSESGMTGLADMAYAGSTAAFDGSATCVFSAESSIRNPDAVNIERPAEVRAFARPFEQREFIRSAS